MKQQETIAAIATAPGAAAVGIVRLSGSGAIALAQRVFAACSGKPLAALNGYTALLGTVRSGERILDEAIAYVYRAPKSYTGEDSVELCCHGGSYILRQVLQCCIDAGARPAFAGEFTKRAFLNGKMNLSQAEAVCDLIAAQGEAARRTALAAKNGALSTAVGRIVENLTGLSAHLAAWSDYPEEDLAPVDSVALADSLSDILVNMQELIVSYDRGRLIREGITTAIVGKPNVGKSTLMNLLTGTARSIVTDIPGTTRDVVEDVVRMGEYTLCLLDTAGIRHTEDPVEQVGVSLAKDRLRSAQLVLAVFDSSLPLDEQDQLLLALLGDVPCVAVVNKSDLPSALDLAELRKYIPEVVEISAISGEGRSELEECILSLLKLDKLDPSAAVVANERQHYCLLRAGDHLDEAVQALRAGVTLDAVNVCIDIALDALLELTGERASEKVVDQVFARFCVGK